VPPHWFAWLSERPSIAILVGAQGPSLAGFSWKGTTSYQLLLRIGMTCPFFHTRAEPPDYQRLRAESCERHAQCNDDVVVCWMVHRKWWALAVLPLFHITACLRDARLDFCGRDLGNQASVGPGLGWAACFRTSSDPLDMYSHDDQLICSRVRGSINMTFPGLVYIGGGGAPCPRQLRRQLFDRFTLRFVEAWPHPISAAVTLFNPVRRRSCSA